MDEATVQNEENEKETITEKVKDNEVNENEMNETVNVNEVNENAIQEEKEVEIEKEKGVEVEKEAENQGNNNQGYENLTQTEFWDIAFENDEIYDKVVND
ncbi:hypothetical protein Tco_0936409 [Tanacetum coccineum]